MRVKRNFFDTREGSTVYESFLAMASQKFTTSEVLQILMGSVNDNQESSYREWDGGSDVEAGVFGDYRISSITTRP